MEKIRTNSYLNRITTIMLILNLFIVTSRMSFLPWFIEDGWGYLGLILTSIVLLIVFAKSYQLYKNEDLSKLQTYIPLVSALFSIFLLFMHSSDFMTIFALVVNAGTICLLFFIIWNSTRLSSN